MGLYATKPVFGVSDEVRFKPACSATETSLKIEFLLIVSLDMIFSTRRITKDALFGYNKGCGGWSAPLLFANPRRQGFSRRGQYNAKSFLFACWVILFDFMSSVDVYIFRQILSGIPPECQTV